MNRLALASLGLLLALSACLGPSEPPRPLLFTSTRDGRSEVYAADPLGRSARRLTESSGGDFAPRWAPDGRRFAFVSLRDGREEVYLAEANGQHPRRLTDAPGRKQALAWAPDGRRLAYLAGEAGDTRLIVLAPGGAPTTVTATPAPYSEGSLAWTPEGRGLTYVALVDGREKIFVQGLDDTHPAQNLTPHESWHHSPAWSPDGRWLAFNSLRGGVWQIWVQAAGRSEPQRPAPMLASAPTWSRDGRWLAWVGQDPAAPGVYVWPIAGGPPRWVYAGTGDESGLSWSPDGRQIAFQASIDGEFQVVVAATDGRGATTITRGPRGNYRPDWAP